MTLIIHLTETQITIAWIAYIVGWFLLFFYVRRWSKKKVKQIDHAHKMECPPFSGPIDIPEEDLDLFTGERPYIEYRAGCN